MKTFRIILVVAVLSRPALLTAAEPAAGNADESKAATNLTEQTNQLAAPQETPSAPTPKATVARLPSDNATNLLRMNFRGASLDQVLNYLSEAAGFIINLKPGVSVRGKVDVWSNDPLTREEALDLLDTVLVQNKLAAIRNGRTLTIVDRDEAKTQNIPVIQGSDPARIPVSDRIVTQIMPVRFVDVGQLLKDLQPLVSVTTQISANEAGNSLVITDTQSNIRKIAEVIHAIDMGAEDVTVVKVFHLQHADPSETADLLTNLFPDDSRSGGNQTPMQFGGPGGFFRRMMGGGGPGGGAFGPGGGGGAAATGGNDPQSQRLKKRYRVVAVADPRTSSVVVTASKDLMEQIQGVIAELDPDDANTRSVAVYRLENAEPQEAMQVLQDMFNKTGTQNNNRNGNTANQNSAFQIRRTTQNQQNNSNSRTTSMTPNSRGGGIGGGNFGQ